MLKPEREDVSQAGGLVQTVHVQAPTAPRWWHWHPEAELTLIVQGRGQRYVGASVQPFEPGDFVLVGGGVPHAWGMADASEPLESWVAHFDSEGLRREVMTHEAFSGVRALLREAEHGLLIGEPTWQRREQARLVRAMQSMHEADRLRRMLGLLELLAELSETPKQALDPSGFTSLTRRRDTTRLDPVWGLIAEQWDQPITLDEAAGAAHLTPSAFARLFKRTMGKTFVQYLHELRIAHACQALTGTDHAVTRIAADSGFANLSNFNRVFRRLQGCSPRAFRQAATSRTAG
ncbi:MAG: AraC family transcriptional regulator [Planctomycetota bacterium]